MPDWHIQRGDKVKTLDEETLRQRVRRRRYSGVELVRREGETAWRRIYELPLFREEVPGGGDPIAAARLKLMSSLIPHVLIFAIVVGSNTHGSFPIWALFWGAGLLSHILQTALKMRELRTLPLPSTPLPEPQPTQPHATTRPPEPTARPASSPWRARVEDVLVALESRAQQGGHPLPDLAALRRDADTLDRDAGELASIASPELLARLRAELAETQTQAAGASDARTAEALQSAAEAIQERLSGAEEAAETLSRLQARQTTLLHQLEGLRLSLLNARADDTAAPDLAAQVREVRARTDAAAELDRQLAAARQRGARARA